MYSEDEANCAEEILLLIFEFIEHVEAGVGRGDVV